MPNWCNNYLQIDGREADLAKFKQENFDDEGLKFSKSCPVPEELGEWDYDWCVANWGTKWDLDEDGFEDWKDRDAWCFQTAWGPPIEWLQTVATKYPSISFTLKYAEGGNDFSGIMEFEDGKCVRDDQGENGAYYGAKYCPACEECIEYDDIDDCWDRELCICMECRDNSFEIISNFIKDKKIEKLPKKLACMRMGRNPIMDNYLMRKVFIPRMREFVNCKGNLLEDV